MSAPLHIAAGLFQLLMLAAVLLQAAEDFRFARRVDWLFMAALALGFAVSVVLLWRGALA